MGKVKVFVIGVGMTKVKKTTKITKITEIQIVSMKKIRFILKTTFELQFEKPGRRENFDYPEMAKESVTRALEDAKIEYKEVKQAVVGYVYGNYHVFHAIILLFINSQKIKVKSRLKIDKSQL